MNTVLFKGMLIGSLLLLVVSCKIGPPVTADYDTSYNYQSLKSYSWVIPKDKTKVSTLNNRRHINAIETILNRKGFNKAESEGKSDFLLKTHTLMDKKTDVSSYYRVWGYHPFAFRHPLHWPHHTTTVAREYEVGTLVLDIVDPVKKEVIWRGSVSRKLGVYKNRTPEERDTIALKNAQFMLESFPPGRKLSD